MRIALCIHVVYCSDSVVSCALFSLLNLVTSSKVEVNSSLFSFLLGPAEPLFKEPYYELLKKALKPDGLLCSQGSRTTFSVDALFGST